MINKLLQKTYKNGNEKNKKKKKRRRRRRFEREKRRGLDCLGARRVAPKMPRAQYIASRDVCCQDAPASYKPALQARHIET